jgi:hypothetical protein
MKHQSIIYIRSSHTFGFLLCTRPVDCGKDRYITSCLIKSVKNGQPLYLHSEVLLLLRDYVHIAKLCEFGFLPDPQRPLYIGHCSHLLLRLILVTPSTVLVNNHLCLDKIHLQTAFQRYSLRSNKASAHVLVVPQVYLQLFMPQLSVRAAVLET